MEKIYEGFKAVLDIIQPGWQYFAVDNEITSLWLAIVLLCVVFVFIALRLVNRKD